MMDVTALSSLLTVLLVVTEPQILTDRIMRVIDLLAATAGLEVDLDADIVDRYSLQAKTDNLGIAGIFLVKVSKKLYLQFFHGRTGAKLIQNLIFERRLCRVLNIEGFSIVLIIDREHLNAVRVVTFEKSLVGTPLATSGVRTGFDASVRVLTDDAAAFALHEHICVDLCPKVLHVAFKAFFLNRHESDHIGNFAEVHGGEVGVNVVVFLQVVEILAEGNEHHSHRNRLTIE